MDAVIITCERCGEPTPKRTYATKHCLPCADAIAQARVGNITATKPIVATATAPQVEPITTSTKARDNTKYGKRHTTGVMNGTETAYAEILEARKRVGEVASWFFEAVTLKLAADCRFLIDFLVVLSDGTIEMIDVKGGGPIDPKSVVKIKIAAEKFTKFRFVVEQKLSKKLGGNWQRTEY